jgi:hypothetical protein
MLASGNLFAREVGKAVALTKSERSAVKVHNLASHITVTCKNEHLCALGKSYGCLLGERVIDDQIAVAILAILAGVAIYVSALAAWVFYLVCCVTNKLLPEENCEIVRTGIEGSVLKEAVVRGCESVMENNTVCKSYEAAKLVKGTENIKVCGSPCVSTAACVTRLGYPHLAGGNVLTASRDVHLTG